MGLVCSVVRDLMLMLQLADFQFGLIEIAENQTGTFEHLLIIAEKQLAKAFFDSHRTVAGSGLMAVSATVPEHPQ
jgi:hypothetical protein